MCLVLNKSNINPLIFELKKSLQFSSKMYLDVVTYLYNVVIYIQTAKLEFTRRFAFVNLFAFVCELVSICVSTFRLS